MPALNNLEKLLNTMSADLMLAETDNLAPLAQVLAGMETLDKLPDLPLALKAQASRSAALIKHIILRETDFENGCKKLSQCFSKMSSGLKSASASLTPDQSRAPQSAVSGQPSALEGEGAADCVPEDCLDLLAKFGSSQGAVLEDFEAYTLELDKGNEQARGAIKRILHTWKGEFGVLSLQSYSQLVHAVEDVLEKNMVRPDELLKLKDFLADRFSHFAAKSVINVSEQDRLVILPAVASALTENQDKKREQRAAEASVLTADHTQSAAPLFQTAPADPSLTADFIAEARDHLHTAETQLLELENDPSKRDSVDTIFRAWHTIKGVAGFLSLSSIQTLAHGMENVMDQVRKNERTLTPQTIDKLLQGNDSLKAFIAALEQAAPGSQFGAPDNYDAIMALLAAPDDAVPASGTQKKVGEILIEKNAATPEQVRQALGVQQSGDERKIGQILVEDQNIPARAVADALARQNAGRAANAIEETIRVPVGRIGSLVDTVGEAVIAQSMIYADAAIKAIADPTLHTKIEHAAMIMRQIQEMAMSLRMVSIKSTFQKMARLARDLSKKFDRELDFVTEGEDTELDKSVVENIGDPLIHMIRNSIDHGIESKEARIAAGKTLKATVKLRAYHRAGSIFIEVSDDGKGLDKEAILKKGISRGLCKEGQNLSEQEIFQFIFLPGFSTAKVVTEVSGRGVGMDVVRRNIEALRGSIEITSAPGKGTTFCIRLPLTLAIVDGMIIRADKDFYIVPTLAIVESLRPSKDQVDSVMHKGHVLKVRGELIPLIHLQSIFHRNGHGWSATEGVVMVVEDMVGKKIGLHVDEIVGQQQVVIKSLGDGMGEVQGVTGGAIMSDGTVSLILDIGGIMKMAVG
jgi:two-component system chemotaxis sensor kinase CheA